MDVIWIIFLFLIGSCVGSFLNVVIYRMPRGESICFPGSYCPSCGRHIRWYDNVPLLGWLILRGKCRDCKKPISPRYLIIEGVTALLFVGLYVCYYMLHMRLGAGIFLKNWPTFIAHIALLCSLLVCSVVDIKYFSVPLEVCWFASIVGAACATASPNPAWMPAISPTTGAVSLAAAVGLVISVLLQRYGLLTPSFIDATDLAIGVTETPESAKPAEEASQEAAPQAPADAEAGASQGQASPAGEAAETSEPAPPAHARRNRSIAIGKENGVNPRAEIMREVLFLAPAIGLAAVAYYLLEYLPAADKWWSGLFSAAHWRGAKHLAGFLSAVHGYLVAGLWVWGIRIFGTLAFGKEAMGLGDVHILAAVGAVCGWIVPSIAFFIAPVMGLIWGLNVLLSRKQHEVPYGPWLAVATVVAMVFFDRFMSFLRPYARTLELLSQ